ncbi:ATP-grasp domain-containing protein [Streptomyces profundus]|uniref:ATP-grasp domain-containing protein n=1 Tax=Streptomyces profundus TaxID=2867410 RepID=UPI001D16BA73|nr:ATP-grasp domain-containing protein [Streptomyces sp. MA3_2.13]UED83843.1 ATP-grasp domain-containing protein [Streptomyces sp. MA3_2.13]
MSSTPVLFCADPLNPRTVDGHFAPEARQVRALGGSVALIDHDALLAGDAALAVARVPRGLGQLWYRGWMIPADDYAALHLALRARDADLVVPPERYRSAHHLPGWYETFAAVTPASAWLPTAPGVVPDAAELARVAKALPAGPGIVKDYVKSRKHEWDEACFVPDLTDVAGLRRVVARLVESQGEFLAGGVVLRAFERFVGEEARVWWLDGEPRLLTPHPDSDAHAVATPELDHLRGPVRDLGARFVTTDVARRDDGGWRVVEVGDAQVSDLHRATAPEEFAALLVGRGEA